MIKIVQLAHPGKEWPGYSHSNNQYIKSNKGIIWKENYEEGIRQWNNLDVHKRKFIFSKDVAYIDSSLKEKRGDLTFWGEWEPHSSFKLISKSSRDFYGPRMIHFPYFDKKYDGSKKHTTDPYVFGENFWYTHCKQNPNQPNQALKSLEEDSIIIMGSERAEDKSFLVDTVFVVEKRFSQHEMRANKKFLPKLLLETNLEINENHELLDASKYSDFGFYKGKNHKVSNMFSFVPAKKYNKTDKGHERLIINTYDKFYNFQRAGAGSVNRVVKKSNSVDEIKEYWDMIVSDAFNQGFVLATNIPEPKIIY